jgi:lysozyme
MEYSRKIDDYLERTNEGCELTSYKDAGGIWTIGYGHTADVHAGQHITLEQAEDWLQGDLAETARQVNAMVHVPLTQNEFDALVDFTFNVGAGNLENSTLLKMLNAGNYTGAARQFERWDKVRGAVIGGLLRRRKEEEKIFDGEVSAT